jgi:hypothetical protein
MVDITLYEDGSFFHKELLSEKDSLAQNILLEFGPVVVSVSELVRDYGVYLTCAGYYKPQIAAVQRFKIHLEDPSGPITYKYLVGKPRWDALKRSSSLLSCVHDGRKVGFGKVKLHTKEVIPQKTLEELMDERLEENRKRLMGTRRQGPVMIGNQTISEYLTT